MADDILGHDHLEHGKHLHKQHRSHKPRERPSDKPKHVAVLAKQEALSWNWKTMTITAIIAALLLFVLYRSLAAIAIAILIIIANTVVEYHKLFTSGIPVDFEVVSVGTAYLAANYGFLPALLVVFAGPLVVEISHGHFSSFITVKYSALLVTALAALVLGNSLVGLFIAVIFGLVAQYFAMLFFGGADPFTNFLRRLTNVALSAYIIFFLLPILLR